MMTSNGETRKRGRGRPRDPARGAAIREATAQLLAEEGYQGLTMVDVAGRAGVAKTTIYRRWPTKADMVLDALAEEFEPRPLEETEDPLDDLRRLTVQFYRRIAGGDQESIAPADLLKEAEVVDAFHEHFVRPMRQQAEDLVERAVEQGHIRRNISPTEIVDALAAPAIYKPVALGERATTQLAEQIFEVVMSGVLVR